MDKGKNKTIFSQKLAAYLMGKGFVLLDMRRDVKGSGKNVFFFRNSDELRDAIYEYEKLNR